MKSTCCLSLIKDLWKNELSSLNRTHFFSIPSLSRQCESAIKCVDKIAKTIPDTKCHTEQIHENIKNDKKVHIFPSLPTHNSSKQQKPMCLVAYKHTIHQSSKSHLKTHVFSSLPTHNPSKQQKPMCLVAYKHTILQSSKCHIKTHVFPSLQTHSITKQQVPHKKPCDL